MSADRTRVFVSYSHADQEWYERIARHLEGTREQGLLEWWGDSQLRSGDEFKQKIKEAIDSASVAVLFLSTHFFTSAFIAENEWPPLLAAAEKEQCRLLVVCVSEFAEEFLETEKWKKLKDIHWINKDQPVMGKSEDEIRRVYGKLVSEIVRISSGETRAQRHDALGAGATADTDSPQKSPSISEPSARRDRSDERQTGEIERGPVGQQYKLLQVIGWKGIENEEIYSEKPENIQDVACLVTTRSLADLPSFTYRKMGFDLVVADIEFIQRYIGKNLLADISPKPPDQTNIETAWDDILPAIADSTEDFMRSEDKLFGIPLQFGFMEILINKRHFDKCASEELKEKLKTYRDGDLTAFSYKDFCVSNIFSKTEVRIGLWDWFLPSLTHLLLTRFDWGAKGTKEETVEDFAKMIPLLSSKEADDVFSITLELRKNGDRVGLYNNLPRLMRDLRRNKIGIVFGGTSSLLTLQEDKDIIPIIPKEGLLIWVNCGCLLEPDNNRERSLELLQYWIKDGTQERLCGYEEYRACPVREETMMKTLASGSHPAHSTLKRVLGEDGDWSGVFKRKIAVRTFPKNVWRYWESAWEENVSVIGQASV